MTAPLTKEQRAEMRARMQMLSMQYPEAHVVMDSWDLLDSHDACEQERDDANEAYETVLEHARQTIESRDVHSVQEVLDALKRARDEAELCTTCGGSPHPSGLICICGGTGSRSQETIGLRKEVLRVEAQRDALAKALEKIANDDRPHEMNWEQIADWRKAIASEAIAARTEPESE